MRYLFLFLLLTLSLHGDNPPIPDPMQLPANWGDFFNNYPTSSQEETNTLIQRIQAYAPLLTSPQESQKFNQRLAEITTQLALLDSFDKEHPSSSPSVWLPREKYTIEDYLHINDQLRSLTAEMVLKKSETNKLRSDASNLKQLLNNTFVYYSSLPANTQERFLQGLKLLSVGLHIKTYEAQIAQLDNQISTLQSSHKRYEDETHLVSKRLNVEIVPDSLQKTREEIRSAFRTLQTQITELQKKSISAQGGNEQALYLNELLLTGLQIQEKNYHAQLHLLDAQEFLSKQLNQPTPVNYKEAIYPLRLFIESTTPQIEDWHLQGSHTMDVLSKEMAVGLKATPSPVQPENASSQQEAAAALTASLDLAASQEPVLYEQILKQSLANRASLDTLNRHIYHLELILHLIEQHIAIKEPLLQQITYYSQSFLHSLFFSLREWVEFSLFDIAGTPITLLGIFKALIIIFIALSLSHFTIRGLERLKGSKHNLEPTLYIFKRIIHYIFVCIGTLIALGSLGLTLQNVAIVLGALGIGIGFGLQHIVNNFLSGLMLLFERNIKIGDYIELENGKTGKVMEINVQNTAILTSEGCDILIPNSTLVTTNIINWTKRGPFQRLHVPFCAAYGTDQDKLSSIVCAAAEQVPSTLLNMHNIPNPEIWLVKLGDNALEYELVVWVNIYHVPGKNSLKAAYLAAIERVLRENKISVPFPQHEIYLRSSPQEILKNFISSTPSNS